MTEVYQGVGARKTAMARVRIVSGQGNILINQLPMEEYFRGLGNAQVAVRQPFKLIEQSGKFDIFVRVAGSGPSAQAMAIRLGISRALVKSNQSYYKPLREAKFLTRDSRMVERKKPGQKKARKKFQFSKR